MRRPRVRPLVAALFWLGAGGLASCGSFGSADTDEPDAGAPDAVTPDGVAPDGGVADGGTEASTLPEGGCGWQPIVEGLDSLPLSAEWSEEGGNTGVTITHDTAMKLEGAGSLRGSTNGTTGGRYFQRSLVQTSEIAPRCLHARFALRRADAWPATASRAIVFRLAGAGSTLNVAFGPDGDVELAEAPVAEQSYVLLSKTPVAATTWITVDVDLDLIQKRIAWRVDDASVLLTAVSTSFAGVIPTHVDLGAVSVDPDARSFWVDELLVE